MKQIWTYVKKTKFIIIITKDLIDSCNNEISLTTLTTLKYNASILNKWNIFIEVS